VRRSGRPGASTTAGGAESELGRKLTGGGSQEAEEDVDELLAFAADCWAGVDGIRLYRTLNARRRLGPLDIQYLLNQKASGGCGAAPGSTEGSEAAASRIGRDGRRARERITCLRDGRLVKDLICRA
jgi:hypothetical protein